MQQWRWGELEEKKQEEEVFIYALCISECVQVTEVDSEAQGEGEKQLEFKKENERNQKGTGPKQGHHLTSLV